MIRNDTPTEAELEAEKSYREYSKLCRDLKSVRDGSQDLIKFLLRIQETVAQLPENAPALLRALNDEFYDGPLAHADAFRVLPMIADLIDAIQTVGDD